MCNKGIYNPNLVYRISRWIYKKYWSEFDLVCELSIRKCHQVELLRNEFIKIWSKQISNIMDLLITYWTVYWKPY